MDVQPLCVRCRVEREGLLGLVQVVAMGVAPARGAADGARLGAGQVLGHHEDVPVLLGEGRPVIAAQVHVIEALGPLERLGPERHVVAVRLNDLGVACLFVSGKAPSFPMPDLALGCLMKPFTAEDVHRSLAMAEDLLRGRETLRPKLPENLTLYEQSSEPLVPEPGYIPSRRSLRTRLEHWISSHHH